MEDDSKKLITVAHLDGFKAELLTAISQLVKKHSPTTGKKWLKSFEVKKFLNISSGTLQTMRNSGAIVFTKIGGTLYYDPDDIQRMLEENKIDAER